MIRKAVERIVEDLPDHVIVGLRNIAERVYSVKKSEAEARVLSQDHDSREPVDIELTHVVLPPWPGELGYEIRYGLPRLELLTGGGVQVLTKRVSIYPGESGIYNEEYFAEEERLFREFAVIRSACAAVPTKGHPEEFRTKWEGIYNKTGYKHYGIGESIAWHPFNVHNCHCGTLDSFCRFSFPRYNPLHKMFNLRSREIPRHIGVQFRNREENPDGRNSDIFNVWNFCGGLSRMIGLPVVCYGKYICGGYPDGITSADSYTLESFDQLARDMEVLRECDIFVAPDSGWADFLSWISIPLILQSDKYGSIQNYLRLGRKAALLEECQREPEKVIGGLIT
jgi:hypothetical protein